MDEWIKLIEYIGKFDVLIIFGFALISILVSMFILVWFRGISFGSFHIPTKGKCNCHSLGISRHIKIDGGNDIGFTIPIWKIIVWGNEWNAIRHIELYRELAKYWSDQTVIDVSRTNILSPLNSIMESKAKKNGKLVILHSEDQERLLNHFKQFPFVILEKII